MESIRTINENVGMEFSDGMLFSDGLVAESDSSSSDTVSTTEMLYNSLGKFYFEAHLHCPPTFLQIVGWNKGEEKVGTKRLYVYVRKVPLLINNSPTGGYWKIDPQVVREYYKEITKPVNNSKSSLVTGNAIIIPGGKFLRYSGHTVPQYDVNELRR